MNQVLKLLFSLLLFFKSYSACLAFDWTDNNIQLLYGEAFELVDADRLTLTLEHANGWALGHNFFFIDVLSGGDLGVEVYSEVYSYFSLSKILSTDVSPWILNDISLFAGINIGNLPEQDYFLAYLAGISLDFKNPYVDYLQIDVAVYKADDVHQRYGWQITPVWSVPFQVLSLDFKFRGFTDFRSANASQAGQFQILAQPQILLDLGNPFKLEKNRLYLGFEYSYWHNKFGIQGLDESVVQGMFLLNF